ncbi:hypothetical protein Hdeb2414_s0069g00770841 [Helianthus debilis subsp. tardiflorus]
MGMLGQFCNTGQIRKWLKSQDNVGVVDGSRFSLIFILFRGVK